MGPNRRAQERERAAARAAEEAKRAEAERKAGVEARKIVEIWNARQAAGEPCGSIRRLALLSQPASHGWRSTVLRAEWWVRLTCARLIAIPAPRSPASSRRYRAGVARWMRPSPNWKCSRLSRRDNVRPQEQCTKSGGAHDPTLCACGDCRLIPAEVCELDGGDGETV